MEKKKQQYVTTGEVRTMQYLRKRGNSYRTIAVMMGRSKSIVYNHLKAADVADRLEQSLRAQKVHPEGGRDLVEA